MTESEDLGKKGETAFLKKFDGEVRLVEGDGSDQVKTKLLPSSTCKQIECTVSPR